MSDLSPAKTALAVLFSGAFLASCAGPQVGTPGALSNGVAPSAGDRPATNCPVDRRGTGLLPDGDFSQEPDPGSSFREEYKGQSFAPAWTVSKHDIDFVGSTYWLIGGFCSVDLDGHTDGGIVSTFFTTKRGKAYTVSFLLSGNGTYDRYDPRIKTLSLQAENQIHVFQWDVSNNNDVQHGRAVGQTWTFRADRTMTTLTFLSRDHKYSGSGPVIADISVIQK